MAPTTPTPRQLSCLSTILTFEGGGRIVYDRDGVTRWGICSRWYPSLDIPKLTREEAEEILLRDYWPIGIPAPLDLPVFDASVNCGPERSIKWLQASINGYIPRDYIAVDGILGPQTRKALHFTPWDKLLLSILNQRLLYYYSLRRKRPHSFAGWIGRVTDLIGILAGGSYSINN